MSATVATARAVGLRSTPGRPAVAGGIAAAATLLAYLPGSERLLDYDGGTTVVDFVATPSLFDPLRRQALGFNNHPLFSFLEHIAYTFGGARSMTAFRLLPIAAGALTVGLVVAALTRRFGLLAAACGGLFLATNGEFAGYSREVRGYSLLTLMAVLSTLLLLRELDRPVPERRMLIAYAVVVAAGLATHLYMVAVVAGHFGLVASRGGIRRWAPAWAAGLALGGAAYIGLVSSMMHSSYNGRAFTPSFIVDVAFYLLAGSVVAVPLALVLVGVGVRSLPRSDPLLRLALIYGCMVVLVWSVLAPAVMAPRYFVWLVPLLAAFVAAAVHRHRVLAGAAVAYAVVMIAVQVPTFASGPYQFHASREPCVLSCAGDGSHAAGKARLGL